MAANWRLREYLASRGVVRASEARRMIQDATGYKLSKQAMCALFKGDLRMLRLETGAAICDTFRCRLSDFFDIAPRDTAAETGNTNIGEFFPNRRNFSS